MALPPGRQALFDLPEQAGSKFHNGRRRQLMSTRIQGAKSLPLCQAAAILVVSLSN
jgi:hypothetical protein